MAKSKAFNELNTHLPKCLLPLLCKLYGLHMDGDAEYLVAPKAKSQVAGNFYHSNL